PNQQSTHAGGRSVGLGRGRAATSRSYDFSHTFCHDPPRGTTLQSACCRCPLELFEQSARRNQNGVSRSVELSASHEPWESRVYRRRPQSQRHPEEQLRQLSAL